MANITEKEATLTPPQMPEATTHAAEKTAHITQDMAAHVAEAVPHSMPVENIFNWSGYFQAIGTLAILLALLWGGLWFLRKYSRFNFLPRPKNFPRGGLCLETQLPLGPRKGLMVVRFLDKRLLLGVTDHQITLLKETAYNDANNSLDFKEIMENAHRQNSDK